MESLFENKPLLYSLMVAGSAIVCLALGILPDLSNQFEIVEFTPEVRLHTCTCHVHTNTSLCYCDTVRVEMVHLITVTSSLLW